MGARVGIQPETVYVPMRDGIKLATDIYSDGSTAQAPVVLVRTPYNKDVHPPNGTAERFAKAGYVVVIQDCRGAHASEGVMVPYNNEGQDGYDCIEWITRQPWCNGRVGMWGASYTGAVQWQAAVEKPPGLVAITPRATWSSFHGNIYLGGAVRLALIAKWAPGRWKRPVGGKPLNQIDWDEILLHLPLSEIDDRIGWPIPWLEGVLTHPEPNGYWKRLDLKAQLPDLDLPALHVVGYYDFFSRESVENYVLMQNHVRNPDVRQQQHLILGPWDHGDLSKSKVGDVEFGAEASLDVIAVSLDWFARYLKQDAKAEAKVFAPVRYFSMGDNTWREAQTWPPPGFTATNFYLRSDGTANTRRGSGRITREPPDGDEIPDTFHADPADPTPACPVTAERPLQNAIWGPVDQTPIEDRSDVLVYTSEALSEPLTFAGHVEARLHVSANTPDADWAIKLVDVSPDGFAQNLASGILRGRFRESLLEPKALRAGQVYEITVDLGPVAATIRAGHRLRVDIAGAMFPLYDRNPNTAEGPLGRKTTIATEKVHHTAAMPSRLILPLR